MRIFKLLPVLFVVWVFTAVSTHAQSETVTIIGDFQLALGCDAGKAECAASQLTFDETHQLWIATFDIPEGSYEYQAITPDGTIGALAEVDGNPITLNVLEDSSVTFFYSPETNWLADNVNHFLANVPGSYQGEVGCPETILGTEENDWGPDCLQTLLQDPDNDGIYEYRTTLIPVGNYEAKVALNQSWSENYGDEGAPGGANIPFVVTKANAEVLFVWDSESKIMTILAEGAPKGNLGEAKAYWLTPDLIATKLEPEDGITFALKFDANAQLELTETGVVGGTTIPLTHDPIGIPSEVLEKFPHLAGLTALRLLMRFGSSSPQEAYLETFVDEVEFFIDYYRGKQRTFFERAYERRFKYWPVIEEVFAARNIPTELGYMALVESGYNPRARSHANARGLWQFIPGTGKRYGLYRTEDFYDVQKSTEAAAEYLLDLIAIFGSPSFLLATAAYNAGEGRIQGCLRKLDDPFSKRSFWEIRGCLAKETREYVPRIMAAVVIGSNPERFGFQLMGSEDVKERYDIVTIPAITRLSEVARQSGVSVADLRTANTDLASTATSTPSRNFPLYIPKGGGVRLVGSLAANPSAGAPWPQDASRLAESTPEVRPVRPPQVEVQVEPSPAPAPRGETVEYVARRGDTLVEIAKRHGVRVSDLKAWNPFLKRRVLFRGDRLTIHAKGSGAAGGGTTATVEYRVRRGDNLSGIAQRHGVPWRSIAEWNNLRPPYRLRVGQRLTIRGGAGQSSSRPRVVYTVKRGNSLQTIAQVFSVRYRDIMSWNGLRSSRLQPGQELVIHPRRAMRAERVRVKRGDTVGKIARRHGVSVSDILTVNGLSARSVIRPGQRLLVYIPG